MPNYDQKLDLSTHTSTGMILSKVERGSTVLELGCAAGRMTRYMKEDLGCQVYIVERDRESYAKAAAFAAGGVCGDIQDYRWEKKFSAIRFDAVVCADVLEHLTAPEEVLARAAGLLKDTGRVFVSIPNVTHNDVLLKAAQGRFDYTPLGLLDDTHVRFWGLENLTSLAEKSGLTLRSVEGTPCPTGYTEQYGQGVPGRRLLQDILLERPEGEVYQFILTLDKQGARETKYALPPRTLTGRVYLDTGRDFREEERLELAQPFSGGGYHAHIVLEDTGKLRRVRFDPVEGQGCFLRDFSIRQGGEELELIRSEGADLGTGILLPGDDPYVYAEVPGGRGPVTIDGEVLLWGESYLEAVQAACLAQSGRVASLTSENGALRGAKDRLKTANSMLHQEVDQLQALRAGEREQYEKDLTILREEREDLNAQLSSLAGEKAGLEQSVRDLCAENGLYAALTARKERYVIELERELEAYKGLRVVRAYFFVYRAGRWLKNTAKRGLKWLLRKPYHALRRCARWGRDTARRILRR